MPHSLSVPYCICNQNDCFGYFFKNSSPDYNRCDDKGYLQFIRLLGLFLFITLSCQAFQLLNALSSGETLTANKVGGNQASLLPGFGQDQYAPPQPSTQPAAGADGNAAVVPQSTSYQAL
jgi:hypothetical protein